MFVVLLALRDMPDSSREPLLALAEALAGKQEGMLVCRTGSSLAVEAAERSIPLLTSTVSSPLHPLLLFRLWLRLRNKRRVLLQSFEGRAATLARLCSRLRKPASSLLVPTFFFAVETGSRAFKKNIETADCIVCGSEALAEETGRANGIEAGKLRAFPPGTPRNAYEERRETERFIICMPGSLEQGRGQSLLIRAMSALWQIKDLPPWEVRLIGSGPMFSALLEEAHTLGVADRLAILGEENLFWALPYSSVLILPLSERVYAPYFAAGRITGLPVIGPDLPACREFARHERDALLVTPGNPQALAAAVLRLIREPKTAHALALNGKNAFAPLGMECMVENFYALYRELFTEKTSAP